MSAYDEFLKRQRFSIQAPFNFVSVDRSRVERDGQLIDDLEYLKAASNIHNNHIFHEEMALLSAELANEINKDTYDATVLALAFIRRLVGRFEDLNSRLEDLQKSPEKDEEETSTNDQPFSSVSDALEYSSDLQV